MGHPPELLFYGLFDRLRKQTELSLSMDQYFLLLQAFRNHYGQPLITGEDGKERPARWEEADLRFLCKTMWLTHPRFETRFDQIFDEYMEMLRRPADVVRYEKQQAPPAEEPEPGPGMDGSPAMNIQEGPRAERPDQKPGFPLDSEPDGQKASDDEIPQIFVDISKREDAEGTANGEEEEDEEPMAIDRHPFIFSDKYLPLNSRRLKHYWQHLRRFSDRSDSTEIDVKATIDTLYYNGFIDRIAWLPQKEYTAHFAIIVDNEGSMIAHQAWVESLVRTIRETVGHKYSSVHYFYNYPGRVLYQDPRHTQPVDIGRWLRKMDQPHIFLFIISDGGATRWAAGNDRIAEWGAFFARIDRRIDYKVWLNPMPRARWEGKSALYLSLMAEMVEATEEGLSRIPEIIKHL